MRIADCVADYDAISIVGRVCRVWALLVGVAAVFVVGIGCANGDGSGAHSSPPTSDEQATAPAIALPAWILFTPSSPGVAIYGVGSASFAIAEQKARAILEADSVARRQIALRMGQQIEVMIKSYFGGIVTEHGQISEESLAQDVMRAFTDRCLMRAPIIRRFTTAAPDAHGLMNLFALAVVDFDFVATVIREAAVNSQAVAHIIDRAKNPFADLPDRLEDAQREVYRRAHRLAPPTAHEQIFVPAERLSLMALALPGPAWIRAVPSAPGIAFYGVGWAIGESEAANEARACAWANVEIVVGRVVEAVADAAGFADAAKVAEHAMRAVRAMCVAAAPVIRRFAVTWGDGQHTTFALVEVDFHVVLDALRAAVLNAPGNGGDFARIRAAFANVAETAIIEQRYFADSDAVPLGSPIAGEVAGVDTDSE